VRKFCDLALYSLTFNNDVEHDLRTLENYKRFRIEASELGIRHFMEVFNPNAPVNLKESDYGSFVNDHIIRTLAGVTAEERPLFLKIAYNGSNSLRELAEHDSTLTVGILGGSSGTTRDTFELLHRAEKAGSRVALFGRKIQRAESQTDIVRLFRPVIEGKLTPVQAVEQYHAALEKKKSPSIRPLSADLKITEKILIGE
jgi:DhnA family fructose-bisphosphate aldolase class Ia